MFRYIRTELWIWRKRKRLGNWVIPVEWATVPIFCLDELLNGPRRNGKPMFKKAYRVQLAEFLRYCLWRLGEE